MNKKQYWKPSIIVVGLSAQEPMLVSKVDSVSTGKVIDIVYGGGSDNPAQSLDLNFDNLNNEDLEEEE